MRCHVHPGGAAYRRGGGEELPVRHGAMLCRVACSYMKNSADAEDMVQETFVRLLRSGMTFTSPAQEKAWLLVTLSNLCKSALRSPWRQRREDIDSLLCPPVVEDVVTDETLPVVLALPEHDKLPVYLFYYEGYQTAEIARMLGTAPATIRVRLNRARQQLKTALSGV